VQVDLYNGRKTDGDTAKEVPCCYTCSVVGLSVCLLVKVYLHTSDIGLPIGCREKRLLTASKYRGN